MAALSGEINVSSGGNRDVIDLTPDIMGFLGNNNHGDGTVTVFAPGSTAAITTLEYEPGLKKDIADYLDRIAPYGDRYSHHETWHDDNGSAHIQAALIGPSVTVPFINGRLALGTWQQVVLIDCDTRPRKRKIVIQYMF